MLESGIMSLLGDTLGVSSTSLLQIDALSACVALCLTLPQLWDGPIIASGVQVIIIK